MTSNPATPPADNPPESPAAQRPAAPVIRRLDVLSEGQDRLWKRVAPAWAISGGVHVFVVMVSLFLFTGRQHPAVADTGVVTTTVDDAKDEEKNLVNPDEGYDPNLEAATNAIKEAEVNIEAPSIETEPIDSKKSETDAVNIGIAQGIGNPNLDGGVTGPAVDTGTARMGEGGGANQFAMRGLGQRNNGATKNKLLQSGGGNPESEAAVARGLAWLAKQQRPDGSWRYDGAKSNEVAAATGMALLPFLAAGETPKYGAKYQKVVASGMAYLMGLVGNNGKIAQASTMYGQGIAAIALCEAVGMTGDKSQLRDKAQAAVNYIVKAQASDGSWGYSPGASGDTSIVGWQVQALKSAMLAEMKVDPNVLTRAAAFLEKMSSEYGSRYGYRDSATATNLRSAVGLLCRQYINKWGPGQQGLIKGVDVFLKTGMPTKSTFDIYYHYYATQVVHFYEGPAWHQQWNPAMRDLLISIQNRNQEDAKNFGSWDGNLDSKNGLSIGSECGRLGVTCLSLLTLEVYYRHLPLNKRDNGGLAELR